MLCHGFKSNLTAQLFNINSQILDIIARCQSIEILTMAMVKVEVWMSVEIGFAEWIKTDFLTRLSQSYALESVPYVPGVGCFDSRQTTHADQFE